MRKKPLSEVTMEYKHILCTFDGSELSEAGLKHAAYLSKTTGARLHILYVVEKWYRAADMATDSPEWQKSTKTGWTRAGNFEAAASKVGLGALTSRRS